MGVPHVPMSVVLIFNRHSEANNLNKFEINAIVEILPINVVLFRSQ